MTYLHGDMLCKLTIDKQPFQFNIEGEFSRGQDEILYRKHPILENCSWEYQGYHIIELFGEQSWIEMQQQSLTIINQLLQEVGTESLKRLEDYHKIVNTDDMHEAVIAKSRFLKASDFSLSFNQISAKISQVLGKQVGIENPKLEEEIIILRISRPESLDINPLHRDGYLDIWEDTINVWIPLAGCDKHSSLPVIPGSHFWNEKDVLRTAPKGAIINGKSYHVPGIIDGPKGLQAIRPNPQARQALIFTPFLAHGSAVNQNSDTTRMSLELRLCLK